MTDSIPIDDLKNGDRIMVQIGRKGKYRMVGTFAGVVKNEDGWCIRIRCERYGTKPVEFLTKDVVRIERR